MYLDIVEESVLLNFWKKITIVMLMEFELVLNMSGMEESYWLDSKLDLLRTYSENVARGIIPI